jgi:hypothetical protein
MDKRATKFTGRTEIISAASVPSVALLLFYAYGAYGASRIDSSIPFWIWPGIAKSDRESRRFDTGIS